MFNNLSTYQFVPTQILFECTYMIYGTTGAPDVLAKDATIADSVAILQITFPSVAKICDVMQCHIQAKGKL